MSRAELPSIPLNWSWALLGEIAEVKLGKMLSPKAQEEGLSRLPYLRNQNIRWGVIDYSDVKTMGFKLSELERYSLKPGDLLVCEGGEPGRCAVYLREPGDFMYQKALHRIRPYGGLVLSKYLQFCLWNYVANGLVIPRPSETTIQHLPLERMLELPIPVAPYGEQERIVFEIEKHLTRLDVAVALLKKIQAQLKRYRTAVLKAACEGRLASSASQGSSETEAPLHEGWTWTTLSQLSWDSGYGTSQKCNYEALGPPVIRIPNIADGRLNLSNLKRATSNGDLSSDDALRPGDFLIVRTNGSRDLIGRGAIVPDGFPESHYFASYLIRFRLKGPASLQRWIGLIWDSPLMRSHLEANAASSAGQYNISLRTLENLPIPLPDPSAIGRLVAELDSRLSVISKIEATVSNSLSHSTALRQTMLRSAFSGLLTCQDPNEEPASALLERLRQAKQVQGEDRQTRRRSSRPAPEGHPDVAQSVNPRKVAPTLLPVPRRGDISDSSAEDASPPGHGKPGRSRTRHSHARLQQVAPTRLNKERAQEEPAGSFTDLPSEDQIDVIWASLLGRGALEKGEAVRATAETLRERGLARFTRLRQGSALYETIEAAVGRGLRAGDFDRPKRGHVRAVLSDPRDYPSELWSFCLLESFDHHAVEEGDALRAAAEWARENMGLEYGRLREDGIILRGLRAALDEAIRRGDIERIGRKQIRRT